MGYARRTEMGDAGHSTWKRDKIMTVETIGRAKGLSDENIYVYIWSLLKAEYGSTVQSLSIMFVIS